MPLQRRTGLLWVVLAAQLMLTMDFVGMHFSMLFMLAQYLQRVLGLGPLVAGLAYVPLTAMVFMIAHFVPSLVAICGTRALLVAGSLVVGLSLALFATLHENSGYMHGVLLPLLVHAAGIALVFAPGTMAIVHAVPEQDAGSASGLSQMDQQLGGALGIAIVAAIQAIGARPGQAIAGMPQAYLGAAAIAILAAFVAFGCAGRSAAVIRAGRAQ